MKPSEKEVKVEFPGLIRVYKDGSVERLWDCPVVPCSPEDPETNVSSKDVTISEDTGVSARLYLPKMKNQTPTQNQKLPVLVYYHGGGFCIESASSLSTHRYMNILSSQAQALVVSVEYRLAPEHPMPTAYEDSWAALNWVASHRQGSCVSSKHDLWLTLHGDLDALFIGGDSSGANIAHNMAMRAGTESLENGVKILGAFLSQSYLLAKPEASEERDQLEMAYKIWEFVYPDAEGGRDNNMLNPMVPGAPSLSRLGCDKVLVIVSGEDVVRGSGIKYYEAVRESGYAGSVELFEVEGEGHGFHIFNPETLKAKLLFQRLVSFIQN